MGLRCQVAVGKHKAVMSATYLDRRSNMNVVVRDVKHRNLNRMTNARPDYSIASATRGMHWLVFVMNPQSRAKSKKWTLRLKSTSWVDALLEYQSARNDGMHILVMVSPEHESVWERRLNPTV